MEFTLEEITQLINGPLNDEDLFAICEQMCIAVLSLDAMQCRKTMITKETVFLKQDSMIRIEVDLHRQNIAKEDLLANHVYAIGTVLLWLAESKSPHRDRDQMLENLMTEMMTPSSTGRPTLEIVSQACAMILQQFQVSSSDILNALYEDCSQNPNASDLVEKRKKYKLRGPQIKPRTKSPYQLVSIEDKEGELRDGSLIEEPSEQMQKNEKPVTNQEDQDQDMDKVDQDETSSSHGTHDILYDLDLDMNPPNEGTWDYDHMEVSAEPEDLKENLKESKDHITPINPPLVKTKRSDSVMSKQTSEDREVENFTKSDQILAKTLSKAKSENQSDSDESSNKEELSDQNNRFRSLSNDRKSSEGSTDKIIKPTVVQMKTEEIIELKVNTDNAEEYLAPATFIKKPTKPKTKTSDLWKRAGVSIKSKLPSNKGLLGVVKQAENQGHIKTKIFSKKNLTKAIAAMAKKQADTESHDPDVNGATANGATANGATANGSGNQSNETETGEAAVKNEKCKEEAVPN